MAKFKKNKNKNKFTKFNVIYHLVGSSRLKLTKYNLDNTHSHIFRMERVYCWLAKCTF